MAIAKYFVKQGLVQKSTKSILGGFDLNRFVIWLLGKLQITIYDETNPTATTKPVRFNTVSGDLEYFNGTTWVSVPSTGLGA